MKIIISLILKLNNVNSIIAYFAIMIKNNTIIFTQNINKSNRKNIITLLL